MFCTRHEEEPLRSYGYTRQWRTKREAWKEQKRVRMMMMMNDDDDDDDGDDDDDDNDARGSRMN